VPGHSPFSLKDGDGLMCVHYDQPDGAPPPRANDIGAARAWAGDPSSPFECLLTTFRQGIAERRSMGFD
jgi:hypothetical protein